MAKFNNNYLDSFLGVVRKYMQMRGNLSQKELSEVAEVGVSTISRLLNKKTTDIDGQLVARIVARLEIPLHEVVDFVEEEYTEKFIRLVRFYKDESGERSDEGETIPAGPASTQSALKDPYEDALLGLGTAQRKANARVKVGGKRMTIPFQADGSSRNTEGDLRDKISLLSPRQKAYIVDFLNLDVEGRDLMVDLGNALFRYFRQKGVEY